MADVATLGLKIDANGALRGIKQVDAGLKTLGTDAKKAADGIGGSFEKAASRIGSAFAIVFGAVAVKQIGDLTKQAIGLADAYASMTARLENAVGSVSNFAQLQAALSQAAQRSRTSLEDLTGLYGRLTIATEAAGRSQAETLRVTEAITQAALVSGASTQEASNAIRQLAQGFASGTLRGEELNSVLEQMPRLASAIAAGMGISVGELRKFGQEGRLTSQEVFQAILDQSQRITEEFERMPLTVGQAGTVMSNALLEVLGIINQNTGAAQGLANVFVALAGGMRGFATNVVAFASAVVESIAQVITGFGVVFDVLSKLPGSSNGPLAQAAKAADRWALSLVSASMKLDGAAEALNTFNPSVSTTAKNATTASKAVADLGKAAEQTATKAAPLENIFAWLLNDERANRARELRRAVEELGGAVPPVQQQLLTVTEPPAQSLTAWQNFTGAVVNIFNDLGQWLSEKSTEIGDMFLATFQRIAQRGKATFGDVFAGLSQLGVGGNAGQAVFGAASIVVDLVTGSRERIKAAFKLVDDQLESLADTFESFSRSFGAPVGEFTRELQRIADFVRDTTKQIDDILTITARRALSRAGGDAGAALASLREREAQGLTNLGPAIAQLEAYIKATDDLREAQRAATEAAREAQRQRFEQAQQDARVRLLSAMGRSDEAQALQRQIQLQRDISAAYREFGAVMGSAIAGMLAQAYLLEEQAIAAAKEAERNRTIAGLDASIAREGGDEATATRIEREILLAEVTDEVIRAKYEELFALQDLNKATREAAEAAELLAKQQERSEDLEVRRLVATGDAIAAEELRFKLEQERELRRAEAELARGEITQELFDQLVEVLGLEATAFASRNNPLDPVAGASAAGAAASRGGVGSVSNLATAQVQDIDRVVGELTTIRVRAGQLVQLMTQLVRGGGILGAVNAGIQSQTQNQSIVNGNLVVA